MYNKKNKTALADLICSYRLASFLAVNSFCWWVLYWTLSTNTCFVCTTFYFPSYGVDKMTALLPFDFVTCILLHKPCHMIQHKDALTRDLRQSFEEVLLIATLKVSSETGHCSAQCAISHLNASYLLCQLSRGNEVTNYLFTCKAKRPRWTSKWSFASPS